MSIATSAIRRMGKVMGVQAISPSKHEGPRLGRYVLKERLGRRTWKAIDQKREKLVLVQAVGRAAQAPQIAKRNKKISEKEHPVVLPWYKITVCGDLTLGARRFLESADRHENMRSAYMISQAVMHLHQLGVPHGAIDADHVLFDRGGAPVLCGFRLKGTIEEDVVALRVLLEDWIKLDRESYGTSAEIVEELHRRFIESRT